MRITRAQAGTNSIQTRIPTDLAARLLTFALDMHTPASNISGFESEYQNPSKILLVDFEIRLGISYP